jgi:hypothetical protein
MGNSNQARYVDADKLKMALYSLHPAVGASYSSGLLDQQVNQLILNALTNSFESFKHQLINAIDQASVPYDKCMLCVQRDSCIPPDPRLPS